MYGWTGKILQINLSDLEYSVITPPRETYHRYIGGKGLAGHFLKDYITQEWHSEYMPLLFFNGPLVNTASPTSGRMTVMSRSPLTGTVGDTSVGGKFGTQLKKAGYDGLIISGICNELTGIAIEDEKITFKKAGHLKNKTSSEIYEAVYTGGSVASTGPAAENGTLYASIAIDKHFMAGRGGLGLIMASKKLKYITVKGSGTTTIFDKEELRKSREEIFRLTAASPALQGEFGIANIGTGALYDLMHARYMMPTDNFRKTRFEHAPAMNAWSYIKKYKPKKSGCMGCHILCKKTGKNKEILPEFETMSHFSALIENSSIEAVVKANHLCNELGMDSISTGATIACYKEITGKSLNKDTILDLISDIAYSKSEGQVLKLGSYRYAESLRKKACSMTVKKLELPAYDPRGAYGMALAYATSTRGGCHLRAYPISHEILRKPVATDRFTFSGKARIIKIAEDMNAMVDSLTACKFVFIASTLEEYARALYGVTGYESSAQDLLLTGERIYFNDRIMNAQNGFTAKDDILPDRFFNENGTSGAGVSMQAINKEEFIKARNRYYKIRGLDKNGVPLKEKIEKLGL